MEINGIEYSEECLKKLSELGIEANKAWLMFRDFIHFCEKSEITLEEAVKTIQSIDPYEIFKNLDTSKISDIFSNR
jgi:hypothetical protein